MKSQLLVDTERNIKRMKLDMTDAEFNEILRRERVIAKWARAAFFGGAAFTAAVCVYDPLAETLVAVVQSLVEALV